MKNKVNERKEKRENKGRNNGRSHARKGILSGEQIEKERMRE